MSDPITRMFREASRDLHSVSGELTTAELIAAAQVSATLANAAATALLAVLAADELTEDATRAAISPWLAELGIPVEFRDRKTAPLARIARLEAAVSELANGLPFADAREILQRHGVDDL